jgi:hypothetical protein
VDWPLRDDEHVLGVTGLPVVEGALADVVQLFKTWRLGQDGADVAAGARKAGQRREAGGEKVAPPRGKGSRGGDLQQVDGYLIESRRLGTDRRSGR